MLVILLSDLVYRNFKLGLVWPMFIWVRMVCSCILSRSRVAGPPFWGQGVTTWYQSLVERFMGIVELDSWELRVELVVEPWG